MGILFCEVQGPGPFPDHWPSGRDLELSLPTPPGLNLRLGSQAPLQTTTEGRGHLRSWEQTWEQASGLGVTPTEDVELGWHTRDSSTRYSSPGLLLASGAELVGGGDL